jgi:dCTP deaminase
MMLTDSDILRHMKDKMIEIKPFNEDRLGSNSYDLSLGNKLLVYTGKTLDAKKDNPYKIIDIPDKGILLLPNELYLGCTVEYTKADPCLVPLIEGTSSAGRLGIQVHMTAGFGDAGFSGHWTLEIKVVKPVIVYAGMPICQIYYHRTLGECLKPYSVKKSAHYNNDTPRPMPSAMWTKIQ